MKRRHFTSAVITLALVILSFSFLASVTATLPYDPWVDINDDGKIDIKDVAAAAARFGTSGETLAKAYLAYDSDWIDITNMAGQYFDVTHNLNSSEIIVDITGKTAVDGGSHQKHLGLTGYIPGWTRTYGLASNEYINSVIQTGDGGYALAGGTNSSGKGGYDAWLVKTDAFGHLDWNRTYGGAFNDDAVSVVQTIDGGYGVFGTTRSLGDTTGDFWLVKVDQFGFEQWNKTYSKATRWDRGRAMAYCSDEGFILAGVAEWTGSPWSQVWLVRTNSTGHKQWDYTYGQNVGYISTYTRHDRVVLETSDGGFAVAATRYPNPTYQSVWFFKTDENGTMLWNKTYGTTNHQDGGMGLVETPIGGYAIAGYTDSYGAGGRDFWLLKTNSTGDKEWDKTYGGTDDDQAKSLVQTLSGGYAIAGYTESYGSGDYDFWLIQTDSAGNMEWNQTYGGTNRDDPASVVQLLDGGYALAGNTYSYGAGIADGWLIKTAVESGLAWTDSTADTITLYRGESDSYWNYVRVRIWRIKENP
ncbi:MAG: hypothetical protein JSW72_02525 [Candidatus Bathyarchaeota archaeon]|nr:MAG: hypothetical protein JSW72_02525 [Candidatus Bathyarchaeota archaeon]